MNNFYTPELQSLTNQLSADLLDTQCTVNISTSGITATLRLSKDQSEWIFWCHPKPLDGVPGVWSALLIGLAYGRICGFLHYPKDENVKASFISIGIEGGSVTCTDDAIVWHVPLARADLLICLLGSDRRKKTREFFANKSRPINVDVEVLE